MFATKRLRRRDGGSILVVVAFATICVAGLSLVMLQSSTSAYRSARARSEAAKAFYVMEGGLDWTVSQLANDPYFAANDTVHFPTANADGSFTTDWMPLGKSAGEFRATVTYANVNPVPAGWKSAGLPPGFQKFATVHFANRTQALEFERYLVCVESRYNGTERRCRAVLKTEFKAYAAALISDGIPIDDAGDGTALSLARDGHAVVLAGAGQYVHGGLASNGHAYKDGAETELTAANLTASMPNFRGALKPNAYGTSEELPDYTAPGTAQQLFDFDLLRAAAQAGKGSYYASLGAFATAMNAANAADRPLQGVVFVTVDANTEGSAALITSGAAGTTNGHEDKKDKSGGSGVVIPGGIHVKGSLALHVINAPDEQYRVSIDTPLFVNDAPVSGSFDPANPATFTTGYPPALDPSTDPHSFGTVKAGDDFPAVAIDNGALEILNAASVCGVVYAPSFLRIDNSHDQRQFFDGAILAGSGIYADGGAPKNGSQTIAFDPHALDDLLTYDRLGKSPVLSAYVIEK